MKIHKVSVKSDEQRKKLFSEHGQKSLKKYEHESLAEQKAEKDSKKSVKPKVAKVMHELKEHKLHSGSKKGPLVTNKKQGLAIALSEAGLSKKSNKHKK